MMSTVKPPLSFITKSSGLSCSLLFILVPFCSSKPRYHTVGCSRNPSYPTLHPHHLIRILCYDSLTKPNRLFGDIYPNPVTSGHGVVLISAAYIPTIAWLIRFNPIKTHEQLIKHHWI